MCQQAVASAIARPIGSFGRNTHRDAGRGANPNGSIFHPAPDEYYA